jgi:hypothetical protein
MTYRSDVFRRGMQRAMLFAVAGALVGCNGGGTPAEAPGGTAGAAGRVGVGGAAGASGGAGGANANACQGGAAFSYLVRSLVTFEPADAGVLVHGFDLDGRVSDGAAPEDCRITDGISPDGRTGIDNAIGGFWGEDFAPAFGRSYAMGVSPVVIQLSGVDSFDDDDCVDVEWSSAQWADATVDPASPEAAGRELRRNGPIARLAGARIEAGRLLASGDAPIELRALFGALDSLRDFVFPLQLSRLSFAASAERLTKGELGGHVEPETVYQAYQVLCGSFCPRALVDSILLPDLPSGKTTCALLSAGFGFDAVRVVLEPESDR